MARCRVSHQWKDEKTILKHNLITALIATLEKWRKDIKMRADEKAINYPMPTMTAEELHELMRGGDHTYDEKGNLIY